MMGVTIVRARTGAPSFLVRRMETEAAFWQDFKALVRGPRGTSRFMVLLSEADWQK